MPRSRRNTNVQKYQRRASRALSRIFGRDNVKMEWDVAKNSQDAFSRRLYCPRLDIAVGPFNIDRRIEANNALINRAFEENEGFIRLLIRHSENPALDFHELQAKRNQNPRCFLAIEIENSGSSKHMLGNIANVSILGSIGVIVPFNNEKLSLCKRIDSYVGFAARVGKVKSVFKNVLIINKENFLRILRMR